VISRRRIPLGVVLSLLVLVTTVPLGLFAAGLIGASQRQQHAIVDRQNIEIARAISVAIDQEVERTIGALNVLSSFLPAGDDYRAFSETAVRIAPEQQWDSIRVASPDGTVLMATEVPFGTPVTLRDSDWVRDAVAERRAVVSTVRKDPVHGRWVVWIGVPIVRTGAVKFVLGARIRASVFGDILRRQNAPRDGVLTLLDQQPVIVARTLNEAARVGLPPTADFVERSRDVPEGAWPTTTLEGTRSYAAWSRSPITRWTVGLGMPAAAVDAPIHRSVYALGAAGSAIMALGLGCAVVIRRRLVASQVAAALAARALARGEPVSPPDSSIAELQDLAAALRDAGTILDTRLSERDQAQGAAERQRTALLEREQAARRTAESLSRAKDEFVATVSHELRTPLNAIYGWVSLLRAGTLDPSRLTQGLEVIHRNTVAQLTLIDDLLDMSRVIRGVLRLDMQPVDLAVAVDAAIDALRPTADARRIGLSVAADRGVALVAADQSRLQQMIFNMISNSLKFTPPDGRITVRMSAEGEEAVLRIEDTGEGIAPEFVPHVFDRFRQEQSASTRSHAGLGIGLSLVRHLTELHGGTVAVESPGKGQGAIFTLRLPLLGTRAAGGKAPGPAAEGLAVRALDGLRVLVVDDEADAREVMAVTLRDAGAEPTTAASVAEALAALETASPHAVVSDIAMPGRTGYDLARALKDNPLTASIPLIAVTAYTRAEDREDALAAGFDAHVAKPFDPRSLVGLLAGLHPKQHS
jgi:signal transduction histidine kinase